jgi:hypothetical protein
LNDANNNAINSGNQQNFDSPQQHDNVGQKKQERINLGQQQHSDLQAAPDDDHLPFLSV